LDAIEGQIAHGAMHSHTVQGRFAGRINALESGLYGLIDLLVEKRMLGESEVAARADRIGDQIEQAREQAHGDVALRADPTEGQDFVPVNCAERMSICKAVCCKLDFALTAEEVESGKLRWDLGKPYFIRHDRHGQCVHRDAAGGCGVYADRPALCRRYSCANDARIWKDFDARILNQEWIDAHLSAERPRLIKIHMERS
jgi:Fe-S-cluster containining protein